MDDLIKELAIKAGGGPSKWYNDPDVLEQFAELIVRECLNAVQNESMNSGDEWEDGLRMAEDAIKQRFGVE